MKKVLSLSLLFCLLGFHFMVPVLWAQPPVPKESKDKTDEAIKEMKQGKFDQAVKLLQEALKFSKYYVEAQINLCTCYFYLNQYAEAKSACEIAIKNSPNLEAQPYTVLGEIAYKEEKYDEAITSLEKALTLDHKGANIYNLLGLSYLKKNNLEKAVQNFREATNNDTANFEAHFYLANTLMQLKRYKEAQGIYEECLTINPKNPFVYYKMATSYTEDNNYPKAIETYNRFLKIAPDNVNTYLRLGETFQQTGDTENALKSYQGAIKINPNQANPYLAIGKIFTLKKDYPKALENLNKALQLDPVLMDGHRMRGMLYLESGKVDEALEDLQEAVRIDSSSEICHVILAVIFEKKKQPEQAMEHLTTALSINAKSGLANYMMGKIKLHRGELTEAVTSLTTALELLPDRVQILNDRGIAYYLSGQKDKAVIDWNKAHSLDKTKAEALINLAIAEIDQKKVSEAQKLLQDAVAMKIDSPALTHALGAVALLQGDLAGARTNFEKAAQAVGDNADPIINLALVAILEKNSVAALDYLNKASGKRTLSSLALQRHTGEAYLLAPKPAEAIDIFSKLPQDDPDVQYNLALGFMLKNDFQTALPLLEKLKAAGKPGADALNNYAFTLYNLNRFPDAVQNLKLAIELEPKQKQLTKNLAATYNAMGQFNEAIKLIQGLGTSTGGQTEQQQISSAYFSRGSSLAAQKKYPLALAEFTKALEAAPDSSAILNNIGAMHLAMGDPDQAIQFFQKGLQTEPSEPLLVLNQAIAFERKGDMQKAYEKFVEYAAKNKKSKTDVDNWIQTYKRLYRYE